MGQRHRLLGPFAAACGYLETGDVSGWQLLLSAEFGAGSHHPNHQAILEGSYGGIMDPDGLAAIFPRPESTGLFYLKRFTGEGPGYAPHQFGGSTSFLLQAVEPDVTGLHPPDLLLFLPQPGGRRGKKWRLYQIDESPTHHPTTTSPFQDYQKLQKEMKAYTSKKNHFF
jgi:hypothetical protein